MTEAILAIKRWGNSLAVRLPAGVAREARLEADQQVRITVENGRVVITPLLRENPSLEQRLARFDPQHHGGEAMAGPRSEPNNGEHARQRGRTRSRQDQLHPAPPVESFDWRVRETALHPIKRLPDELFAEPCAVFNQLVRRA